MQALLRMMLHKSEVYRQNSTPYVVTVSVSVQLPFEGRLCFKIGFDGLKDRLRPHATSQA